MRIYLIEALGAESLSSSNLSISLTPQASLESAKKGVSYGVLEDYYSFEDIYYDQEEYFYKQWEWLKSFDDYLRRSIPSVRAQQLTPALAHYNPLKILIDTIVAESRILNLLFKKTQPNEIVYLRRNSKNIPSSSIYDLYYEKPSFYSLIVSSIAKTRGIKVQYKDIPADGSYSDAGIPLPHRIQSRVRRFLAENFQTRSSGSELRVLLMHAGSLSTDLAWAELKKAGAVVFTEKDVYRGNRFSKSSNSQALLNECERAVNDLPRSGLFDLWNYLCGINIQSILELYLADFIRRECLRDLSEAPGWLEFYKENRIDLLICRSSAGREIATALQATESCPEVKKICLQHGASVLDERYWTMTELKPFDMYLAMDTEAKNYFEECSKVILSGSCRVEESSHYLREISKRPRLAKKRSKERIIYAPAKVFFDIQNFNLTRYPIAWYFELQKKLVDVFSRFPEKEFIYKTLPDQEPRISDSVRKFIENSGIKNVSFDNGLLVDCLKSADRVLLDLPSTALYEAAVMGLPVFSLMPSFCKVWDPAYRMFGASIEKFSSIEEAAVLVQKFLSQAPGVYRASADLKDEDLLNQLMKARNSARLPVSMPMLGHAERLTR